MSSARVGYAAVKAAVLVLAASSPVLGQRGFTQGSNTTASGPAPHVVRPLDDTAPPGMLEAGESTLNNLF